YMMTNDGAPNCRLVGIDLRGGLKNLVWRDIIPERKDVVLGAFTVTRSHIVVSTSRDAIDSLETYALNGKDRRAVRLPALGSVDGPDGSPSSDDVTFVFTSFTLPPAAFRLDPSRATLDAISIPSHAPSLDPARFVV